MRHAILLAALALAHAAAQAGPAYLELSATSPTTIVAGGTVNFRLGVTQHQENWTFDNNGPEPTPDIGFQEWLYAFHESSTERLTEMALQVGAAGGPSASQLLFPGTEPGNVFTTEWNLALVFAQPGTYTVLAQADYTQDKTSRRGDTLGTRECVGFDNSVQCTGWSFIERIHEDSVWTEGGSARSLGLLVQVQAQVLPEPGSAVLVLAGAGLLLGLRRR